MSQRQELMPAEAEELRACEAVIERGLKTFIEVGNALLTIRDKRLYRAEFRSFEEYVANKWDMTRQRAYQLITATKIVEEISDAPRFVMVDVQTPGQPDRTITARVYRATPGEGFGAISRQPPRTVVPLPVSTTVDTPSNATRQVPIHESQVRPLAGLDTPEQRREAWDRAVSAAGGQQPTAKQVSAAVDSIEAMGDEHDAAIPFAEPKSGPPVEPFDIPDHWPYRAPQGVDDWIKVARCTVEDLVQRWQDSATPLAPLIDFLRTTADELETDGAMRIPGQFVHMIRPKKDSIFIRDEPMPMAGESSAQTSPDPP
jgi:hypothetical protein